MNQSTQHMMIPTQRWIKVRRKMIDNNELEYEEEAAPLACGGCARVVALHCGATPANQMAGHTKWANTTMMAWGTGWHA